MPQQQQLSALDQLAFQAYKAYTQAEGDPLIFRWEALDEHSKDRYRAIVRALRPELDGGTGSAQFERVLLSRLRVNGIAVVRDNLKDRSLPGEHVAEDVITYHWRVEALNLAGVSSDVPQMVLDIFNALQDRAVGVTLAGLARRLWTSTSRDFSSDAEETRARHGQIIAFLQRGLPLESEISTEAYYAMLAMMADCLEVYRDNPRRAGE